MCQGRKWEDVSEAQRTALLALNTKSLENVLKILQISKEVCKPNALSSVL